MDINLLISEVFARPALWDRQNKNYHNRQLVEHLWKSVAREMNLKKEEVKKKWKYIRDQFRAELRKISVPISADSANMESEFNSKWPYFKQLLFLKDQIKKISTIPDESGNEDPLEVNDDISSWNISQVEDTDDSCDKFELNIPPPTKKKYLSQTKNLPTYWKLKNVNYAYLNRNTQKTNTEMKIRPFLNLFCRIFVNCNPKLNCYVEWIFRTLYIIMYTKKVKNNQ
uniref:Transcription factor Adf-1 n=1 Tax=Bactrocera dorsalis TaxID=27457 RepID=A0A034WNG7_BACDO